MRVDKLTATTRRYRLPDGLDWLESELLESRKAKAYEPGKKIFPGW